MKSRLAIVQTIAIMKTFAPEKWRHEIAALEWVLQPESKDKFEDLPREAKRAK